MTARVATSPLRRAALSPAIWALALLALVLGLAAPFYDVPMQRDQGVYAACGSILLHGGAPYRDCWDTKGPMTHYTYALAQALFGINLAGPVIVSSLMAAMAGLVLWRVGRRWLGDAIAWAAGLAYGWLVVTIPFDMNAQSEGFANLFIVLGVWAIVGGRGRGWRWRLVGAGAALAAAGLYKYTILLPAAAAALGAFLCLRRAHGRPAGLAVTLEPLLFLAGGFIAVLGLFALYLLARGALALAFEHVIFMLTEFPKVTVNPTLLLVPGEPGPPVFYLRRTLEQGARLPAVYGLGLVGCGLAVLRRRAWGWPLAIWLGAAVVSVYPQKVMTLYHWTLAFPPLALSAAAAAWEVRDRRWLVAGMAVAVAVNLGYRAYADQWLISGPYLTGAMSRADLYASQAVQDEIEVAEYLRARTAPDEQIWVWGNHSIIYYWADRGSPTRFIFNSPLMARIGQNEYQPRWMDEVLRAMYASPPTYIVITWYDRTWFDFKNPVDEFAEIPGYQRFLDRYYRRESFIGRFAIHRLTPWWSRLNPPDLLQAVTRIDLLKEMDRARLVPAPNQPIELREFQLHDEPAYPTLLMHPEGQATFDVALPAGAVCLRADLALDPQSWGWGGDGASFAVAVNGRRVFERTVGNGEADRFWQPALVDLTPWAGQRVTLTLSTGAGPGGDFTGDLAGWGLPRVVVPPGGPHPSCAVRVVQP